MVVALAVALSLLAATLAPRPVDAAAIDTVSTTDLHVVGVPLPGGGVANAINDSGEIVGTSLGVDGHAFYWNGQVGHPVDVTPGDINSSAGLDINNSGQMVGWRWNTGLTSHLAYFWDGTLQNPGGLEALAIDDSGKIILFANAAFNTCGNATNLFCYSLRDGPAGLVTDFPAPVDDEVFGAVDVDNGTVVGGPWSWDSASETFNPVPGNALAIDDGTIVGTVDVGADVHAAILGNPVTDLGTLGGSNSVALGSGNGWVVGWSETSTAGQIHAFYWSVSDGMVDLGTLGGADSAATGVNSAGLIVGWAEDVNGLTRAVVWDPGGDYNPDFPPEIDVVSFHITSAGVPLTITPIVTDPEMDPVTVVWSNLPPGATQTGNSLVWTSPVVGPYVATVTATQNDEPLNVTSVDITITVTSNQPPVLDFIGDQNATVGELLSFTAGATDADLDNFSLTFLLGGATLQDPPPAGAVINPVSGVFTWTPTAGQEGAQTVTVGVQDLPLPPALPLIDEETFTITVGTGGTPVMVTVSEMVGVTDVVTIELGPVPLLITVDEMVGVGDSVAVSPPVEIRITEQVGVKDDLIVRPPVEILISEQVSVGDDVTMTPSLFIQVFEVVGVSDEPTVLPPVQIVIDEQVGVGDDSIVQGSVSITVPERVGVRDLVTITTINLGELVDDFGNAIDEAASGGSGNLMGGGFDPNSMVGISIESDPVPITTTTADIFGNIDVSFVIPLIAPGEHTIVASGLSLPGHPHEVWVPITIVSPVMVTLDPANPAIVASGARLSLSAEFEGHPDITQATIRLEPLSAGSTIDPSSCSADGTTLTCTFTGTPVNTYQMIADAGQTYPGTDQVVLMVHDTKFSVTSGLGWFYWPGTEDIDSGYKGDRSSFALLIQNKRQGTRVAADVLMIRRFRDGSYSYFRERTSLGVAIGGSNGSRWASVVGTAKQWDQNRVQTNHAYLLYVEANAGADRIWIDLGPGSDFEMTSPAFLDSVELERGNINIFRRGGFTIE